MKLSLLLFFPLILSNISAFAQECAVLIRLQSPYLLEQTLYLDELLSQPVINDQICISSNEMEYVDSAYFLELFDGEGRFVESLKIYPEYLQRGRVNIQTADLLSSYCLDCNTARRYHNFVRSEQIRAIAAEMDALIAGTAFPHLAAIMGRYDFQSRLRDYYKNPESQQELRPLPAPEYTETIVISLTPGNGFALYAGAKLSSYFPNGIPLDNIDSLPVVTYSIEASIDTVLHYYQDLYPSYDILYFGSYTVLVKDTLPIDGYAPEYMQIPHLVISEDTIGQGRTLLQMTYLNSDNQPFLP